MPAPRSWIAGPYVWAYNGLTLGITEDGFTFNSTIHGQTITGDNLGDSVQDYVYRGHSVTASGTFNEWDVARRGAIGDGGKVNANCFSPFWPWHAKIGSSGIIGRLGSTVAAPLVGTVLPGTTAAAVDDLPLGRVGISYAVVAPGFNIAQMFNSRLRNVPMQFQALPYPYNADNPVLSSVAWFYLA